MSNKFLKYLGIVLILSLGSLFSKNDLKLSKLNSGVSGQKLSNLNVLAIMVEFEEDTLDYTTGNEVFEATLYFKTLRGKKTGGWGQLDILYRSERIELKY